MPGSPISSLLRNHPDLERLHENLEQLARLQAILAQILPANLIPNSALIKDGLLMLYADNGAVAAKLKQMVPRVRSGLRERGIEVTGIRLQVQARIRDNPLPQKHISVGQAGQVAIDSLTAALPPSKLKSALKRLRGRN